MILKNICNYNVEKIYNGLRIDSYLSKKKNELSRTKIKNLIIKKKLKLNNKITISPQKKYFMGIKLF